jgi:hypothetical protein
MVLVGWLVLVELSAGHALAFDCWQVTPTGANPAEVFVLGIAVAFDDLRFDLADAVSAYEALAVVGFLLPLLGIGNKAVVSMPLTASVVVVEI